MEDNVSDRALAYCRDLSSDVRDQIALLQEYDRESFEAELGQIDLALGELFRRVEGCRRFLSLHRVSDAVRFSFGEVFHQWNPSASGVVLGFSGEGRLPVVGDRDQLILCLDLLAQNAEWGKAEDFEIRVHADSDPPNILVRDSVGAVSRSPLAFCAGLSLGHQAFAERWASATQGGAFAETEDGGLVLDLEGDAPWDSGVPSFATASEFLQRAARTMMPWRGVIGTAETGYSSAEEGAGLYASLLERVTENVEGAAEAIEYEYDS